MKKPEVYKLRMHYRTLVLSVVSALFISFGFSQVASAQVTNLFTNPSVETASGSVPASWASDKWGTTVATFTYPTGGAQDGTRYVKTQVTTKGTGDAKWYPNHVAVTPGQTLTFSDYYQASVQSFVEVEYKLSNGSYQYVRLATLAANSAWTEYTKSFTVPANVQSLTLFHFIQAVGTLSVDNYVLSGGSIVPPPPAPFTYTLSNTGDKNVVQGNSATNAITASLNTGTTAAVNFSASGLPSGVTATFSQNSCSPTCSTTLTLTASASAAIGTALITVNGTSGTTTKTTSFNLTVTAAPVTPPPPPPTGNNLFVNPSVEIANGTLPASWSSNKWGTTVATFSYPTGGAHDGSRYVKTQITTAGTGDAKWYPNHINAVAGKTYTFSDYYQASAQNFVEVEYLLTTGAYQYVRLATLPAAPGWTQYQKVFTAPANVKSMTVLHFIQAVGTLSVDNYVLTDGSTTPPPPPTPFTYTLSNAGNKSVVQGTSVTNTITATLGSGTASAVGFSATGLPTGVTANFSQGSCSPTCSTTLTLVASASATVGTAVVTVSGTSGTTTKTTTFSLTVTSAPVEPPPPAGPNVILNPSVETVNSSNTNLPANWNHEKWGTNTSTFTYIKNAGHTGTHSVKVQITSYTDGDAKWHPHAINVVPGDSYTLSDWYTSNVETYPVIYFAMADGSEYYLGLRPAPASASWAEFKESFQVPLNAKTMTVFHVLSSVGTLTVDDMSVTKITPAGFTRGIVTLAFDDGWEEDVFTVLPVLKDFGFHATMFFATTFLESTPPSGPINESGPAAIHAMQADGHEIGGHSVTHPDLTTLSPADLDYELRHSKEYLESVAGAGQVQNLATPYGTYNDAVIAKAKELQYASLRSTDEGFNSKEDFDQYRIEVQNMQKTTTQAEFQSWIDQAKKDKSWLVLVYHRVATSSLEQFDTPEANFRPQMQYLKDSGVIVLTTQQALQELLPQI